jgi:hypothetical protein
MGNVVLQRLLNPGRVNGGIDFNVIAAVRINEGYVKNPLVMPPPVIMGKGHNCRSGYPKIRLVLDNLAPRR